MEGPLRCELKGGYVLTYTPITFTAHVPQYDSAKTYVYGYVRPCAEPCFVSDVPIDDQVKQIVHRCVAYPTAVLVSIRVDTCGDSSLDPARRPVFVGLLKSIIRNRAPARIMIVDHRRLGVHPLHLTRLYAGLGDIRLECISAGANWDDHHRIEPRVAQMQHLIAATMEHELQRRLIKYADVALPVFDDGGGGGGGATTESDAQVELRFKQLLKRKLLCAVIG